MGVLGWIVVGFIAGAIASRVTGVRRNGCLLTTTIGVLGGLLGGAIFNAAGEQGIADFGLWSIFVAFIGATVLLVAYSAIGGGSRRR